MATRIPVLAAPSGRRLAVFNPHHQRLQQIYRLWPITALTMQHPRCLIKTKEFVGCATAQCFLNGLDVMNSSRSGDDIVRDSMPEDGLTAMGRERPDIGVGCVHGRTIAIHKVVELRFESGQGWSFQGASFGFELIQPKCWCR